MANAVHRLNVDMKHLRSAKAAEGKAETTLKKNVAGEKTALANIAKQEQAVIDQFVGELTSGQPLDPAALSAALNQMFALGKQQVQTKDRFDATIATDKKSITADKKAISKDRQTALKDLKPAELQMSLKATNQVRKELGLKALKHAVRPAAGTGAKAIALAKSLLGKNTQDLKFHGPLKGLLHTWVNDHVCCANFVSAVLQKEHMISNPEHNDSVRGLAANLGRDKNWSRVGTTHLKPGDVVCFDVPGEGHYAHVEFFQGYRNGVPIFIGSNNRNADGSQRVSNGPAGYHIDAVYRHK